MISLGLGANLATKRFGAPEACIEAAIAKIDSEQISVTKRSGLYRTAPVPKSDFPWYINACVRIETKLSPRDLLAEINQLEQQFGRARDKTKDEINAPRCIDIDLITYNSTTIGWPPTPRTTLEYPLTVPHPRMHERAFVLIPLLEIADENWRHPVMGGSIHELLSSLDLENQQIERIEPKS